MEVIAWIKQRKELNAAILSFIESESDSEDEFRALTTIIDDQEIVKNEQSTLEIFRLLYNIGNNHHRTSDFFNRLGRIFEYLRKERLPVKDTEIIDIFRYNKRLLLLLFEHKVIIPDESILQYIIEKSNLKGQIIYLYFFSEIKNFLDKEKVESIKKEISQEFKESVETFEAKIKKGENDSVICKLIREDSIKEFISYVNQTNLPLTSNIEPDFYESNHLLKSLLNLIEYAFFYGSIQIIKYLLNNHVELPQFIQQCSAHSDNLEVVKFAEERLEIDINAVLESIKCHHINITNYLIDKLIDKFGSDYVYRYINQEAIKRCNYFYYPDIISYISHPEKHNFELSFLPSSLTKITIPSSVTSIGNNAFRRCSSLAQISIPSSVTYIDDYAFYMYTLLTQISFEIPSSITSISDYTFSRCLSLTQISIPSSVTKIGNYAFSGCSSLTQISIPFSVTTIGGYAFDECKSLTQISIPSSVTSIGNYAFSGCSSLTQASIPSSINKIDYGTFSGCSSLTQITIPSSVTSIEDKAFNECSSLTQIAIPSSVTSIGNHALMDANH